MRAAARNALVATALLLVAATACGGGGSATAGSRGGPATVRLGYFPNVTHAAALLGIDRGIFASALGADRLETKPFNAGPEAVEALFAGAVDATYIGPNPAVNAFAKSGGKGVRVIAGATSGGAALVVQPAIAGPADLKGRTIASPQLGNTQDVALRAWLATHGLRTTTSGGGDVKVAPQANADTLTEFQAGRIAGAWVPEPWATRLVQEGAGKVLVDERDLWPGGRFVTTHLLVRTEFLRDHPETVRRLLTGHVQATELLNRDPAEGRRVVNQAIEKLTGKRLADQVIEGAWPNLTFTVDPIAPSLDKSAKDAQQLGLLEPVELADLYDLRLLNEVLAAAGAKEVPGL